MNNLQRREAMGKETVWRLLRRFSGPSIISMTVASTYHIADTLFLGRLGREALAAMAITFPVVMAFTAVASGTAIGATSLITRRLGADDRKGADRTAATAVSLCFVLWAVFAVACLPALDTLLRLLGASEVVLPLASSYLKVSIIFLIFHNLFHIMSGIVRSDGNPLFASSVAIGSSLLNIGLDPLFIFGIGPLPAMGIAGAAAATVIAQAAGAGLFIWFLASGRTAYRFSLCSLIPNIGIVANIYRTGVVSIVRSGSQLLIMGVVNHTAASFGLVPLAVTGVLIRTIRFVQMPVLGLGQGMLPLIGYNHGARKKDRVAEIVGKTCLAGLFWTIPCWLIFMLFPVRIMAAFNSDPAFVAVGAPALRIFTFFMLFFGIQIVPGFFFQGIGRGLPATLITVARQVIFVLPALLLLPPFFGVTGIWMAFAVADGLALIFGFSWMLIDFHRQGIDIRWWHVPKS
jgi:putative MATE family efflux protein